MVDDDGVLYIPLVSWISKALGLIKENSNHMFNSFSDRPNPMILNARMAERWELMKKETEDDHGIKWNRDKKKFERR